MNSIQHRDQELAKDIVSSGNPIDSVLEALPHLKTKQQAQYWIRNKLKSYDFRQRISELLDKQGLTIIRANEKLKDLLEAQKTIIIKNQEVNVPDNAVQATALDKLYKLHGLLEPAKEASQATYNTLNQVNISLDAQKSERLLKVVEEIKDIHDRIAQEELVDIKPVIKGAKEENIIAQSPKKEES